ncbi:MAG: exonuclease SbcCD subunit D [Candidatus Bathyarchaeia archaeon]|jgi:exonuclease SbcD
MLIVHTADLHLGIGNYAPVNPSTGLSRRIDDFILALDHIVNYAIENRADMFLLCGDTFKDPNPNSTVLKMFATRLSQLSRENIQTVIILGNHDAPRGGRAAPPEPLIELNVPNVHYFSKPGFTDVVCRSGEKARVFALPYRHPVKVASEKGKTGLRKDLMEQTYLEQIAKEIETFTQAGRGDAEACILTGHFSVQGAIAGSEKAWAIGEEYTVPPTIFDTGLFDYVAMGHVHKHQAINSNVPIVYPGSIERVNLAESEEEKGFVRVEIKNRAVKWEFIRLPSRTMHTFRLDCQADPTVAVQAELASHPIKDAIVSLHITSKDQITPTQKSEINRLLNDAFWSQVHYVRPQPEKQATNGTFAGTLEPVQALGEYLKSLKITEAQRNQVMKIGQQIIQEATAKAEA